MARSAYQVFIHSLAAIGALVVASAAATKLFDRMNNS